MAPVKPKGTASHKARKSTASSSSTKSSLKGIKRPPPKQVKTKPVSATLSQQIKNKRKQRQQYTDSQLNLPAMNSIIPASATAAQRTGKGTGKKKNKIYVDDQESMMTILAMVNAEKEGAIESKLIKERQMEDIREARRQEAEKRAGEKKGKFEEVKKDLKGAKKKNKNAKRKSVDEREETKSKDSKGEEVKRKTRKSVSFA